MQTLSPLQILENLIRCPSVTPVEGGALSFIESVLKPAGFEVHRPIFSEPGTADVENLYARYGTGRPYLLFSGHTDVVPPGDVALWKHDPFSAVVEDGEIYGRGATDMKGGIACMMTATLRFLAKNPNFGGSIGFLITGDEEGVAINGSVKLLDWAHQRGERFDYCILGEPTNPEKLGEMLKIGRRGSLSGSILVHGKQGHVGYPHLARNPIRGMVKLLHSLMEPPLDEGTEHFSHSNLEVTTVDVGNPASNVIPASARAVFNIRFNDLWDPQSLEVEIRRRLNDAADETVSFTATFEPTNAVAFLTKPDAFVTRIQQAIEKETGVKPVLSTTGGTSDARFIKNYCPVVEFGLVGKTMHQLDERTNIDDLERLTAIYEKIAGIYYS